MLLWSPRRITSEALEVSKERIRDRLSDSASTANAGAARRAEMLFRGRECIRATAESRLSAARTVHRQNSVFDVRERTLSHQRLHHRRIETDSIDDDASECIVAHCLSAVLSECVNVYSLFLVVTSGPQNRWVGAPYLYAAGIVCLTDTQFLGRGLRFPGDTFADILDLTNRIADRDLRIAKMPTTPCTKMTPMRMNAKPVFIEV